MGTILVFAEHQNGKFPKSTLSAITAGRQMAAKLGGQCAGAVLGHKAEGLAQELATFGLSPVYLVDGEAFEHSLADAHAAALAELSRSKGVDLLIAAASAMGKDLLPRTAALLDAGMASEVTAINDDGTFVRPSYAGNAFGTVRIESSPQVVSIRPTAFDAAAPQDGAGTVERVEVAVPPEAQRTRFVSFDETKSDRPVLTEAGIVVSGGRGLKNGENFTTYLEPLCDVLGAAMGATRAAVDAGFVPNDLQVGQTGKVVAPALYVAVGISGAIQHLAGMKDSKVIVAINKDAEAPIFTVSDYGLVADLFQALPELTEEIKKLKA